MNLKDGDGDQIGFGRDVYHRNLSPRCLPSTDDPASIQRRKAASVNAALRRAYEAAVDDTKMSNQPQGLVTRKHWEDVYHQPCRVSHFNPLPPARVEGGQVVSKSGGLPYAIVTLECPKRPPDLRGVIAHKVDFRNLWEAFAERGNRTDREVIIFWVKKPRNLFARMIGPFLPGLHVMLCKVGAYDLMTNPDCCPELAGLARYQAEAALVEWKPDAKGAQSGPYFRYENLRQSLRDRE